MTISAKSLKTQDQKAAKRIPSRELTYPILGKGKSSSKVPAGMGYVSSQEDSFQKKKSSEKGNPAILRKLKPMKASFICLFIPIFF